MARWTYLLADLRSNVIAGELPLKNVRLSKVLNGSGQFSADLDMGDVRVQAQAVYAMTRPAIRALYALRDGTPVWGGILWVSEYDSASQSMALAGADFMSYFDHRKVVEILPAPPIAATYVAGLSKVYTATDQNDIARDLVTLAQSHTAGSIGITFASTADSGIPLDRRYDGFDQWYVGEALRELAGLSTGPDIAFDVSGPDASTGRPIRVMRIGTPRLTQGGAGHRWDLGGNLLSFKWKSGGGVMATRVFFQGDGAERGARIAVAEDTSLYTTGWPLLETDQIDTTVTSDTLLATKAAGLQASLRLPTVALDLTVHGDLHPTPGEFAVGDEGRMVISSGRDLLFPQGLDIMVRIDTIDIRVGTEGKEDITLACHVLGQAVT